MDLSLKLMPYEVNLSDPINDLFKKDNDLRTHFLRLDKPEKSIDAMMSERIPIGITPTSFR